MAASPAALHTWARIQRSPTRRLSTRSSARSSSTPGIPPGASTTMCVRNIRVTPISHSPPYRRQLATAASMAGRMSSALLPMKWTVIGQMMPGMLAATGPPFAKTERTRPMYSRIRSSPCRASGSVSTVMNRCSMRSLIRMPYSGCRSSWSEVGVAR